MTTMLELAQQEIAQPSESKQPVVILMAYRNWIMREYDRVSCFLRPFPEIDELKNMMPADPVDCMKAADVLLNAWVTSGDKT